jgi:hypothetical protein
VLHELNYEERSHWLHLALLLALVSILEVGRSSIGSANEFVFSAFVRSLYMWLPALGGISISVGGPNARITRNGLMVGVMLVTLMVLLDLFGGVGFGGEQDAALYPDASVMAQASRVASVSWVGTLADWLRGDLQLAQRVSDTYALDHPRLRAAYALSEGPLIFVVFASIGFVIAAMSWVRSHVVFKRAQDAKTFYIVLAWLIAPLVVELARHFATLQRSRVLFRGASVWRPAVAHIVVTALALLAWWYTARYREPEDS